MTAYFKMESLEFYAKLMFISSQIGQPQVIDNTQVDKLIGIRKAMTVTGKHPALCQKGGQCTCKANNEEQSVDEDLIAKIAKEVTSKILGK